MVTLLSRSPGDLHVSISPFSGDRAAKLPVTVRVELIQVVLPLLVSVKVTPLLITGGMTLPAKALMLVVPIAELVHARAIASLIQV